MSRGARIAVAALAGLAGLSMGGCVGTPDYGPIGVNGNGYGYTDAAIEGGRSIRVILPGGTPDPQLAYVYWNRRAEEICNGDVRRKQIHTAQQQVYDYNRLSGVVGDYVLEGYVWCGPLARAEPAPATSAPATAPS